MRRRINLKLWRLVSAILIPILLLPLALHEKKVCKCVLQRTYTNADLL